MLTFLYAVRLERPDLFNNMSPDQKKIVDAHFEYLKQKLEEGTLVLAGPCLDGAFGIVIFRAKSQKEAEDYMKNDPAVKKKLMKAELHPFRISLLQKIT